jgi:hypothetical protein
MTMSAVRQLFPQSRTLQIGSWDVALGPWLCKNWLVSSDSHGMIPA